MPSKIPAADERPRSTPSRRPAGAAALFALASCAGDPDAGAGPSSEPSQAIRVAHLGRSGGDGAGFAALRAAFAASNPGYGVEWLAGRQEIEARDESLVAFLQSGPARATVTRADGTAQTSDPPLDLGDVVLLRPAERLEAEAAISAVVFTVPEPLPDGLPALVRPDWDERITDTPGGCAEETGAYRRILLTWLETVGPYVFHALNCHRVRIADSFAHYHPLENGFDEFYLVQMVQPGAVLYTSSKTSRIEDPSSVTEGEVPRLLEKHVLEVGDLVYLPRGTVHRGFGGVLAQIITVPGFMPGAEIGVDHHLRAINERLGLAGDRALPFRIASSDRAVVK